MFAILTVAALGATLVTVAAGTVRPPIEDILATVDGKPLTRRDLDIAYRTFQAQRSGSRLAIPPTAEPGVKQRLLQELIDRELLYREAVSRDLDPADDDVARNAAACKANAPGASPPLVPPNVARSMTDTELTAFVRQSLALQKLDQDLSNAISVTSEDVRAYYTANMEKFRVGEEVHVRHILIKTQPPRDEAIAKETIESIRARIEAGEGFAELARTLSDCPSSEQDGDLGRFGRGVMTKEFEQAAFSTPVGSVSDPVKTRFGYHLLKIEAHDQPRLRPVDEVENQIEFTLRRSRTQAAMQRLAAKLRPQGNVWVKDR